MKTTESSVTALFSSNCSRREKGGVSKDEMERTQDENDKKRIERKKYSEDREGRKRSRSGVRFMILGNRRGLSPSTRKKNGFLRRFRSSSRAK